MNPIAARSGRVTFVSKLVKTWFGTSKPARYWALSWKIDMDLPRLEVRAAGFGEKLKLALIQTSSLKHHPLVTRSQVWFIATKPSIFFVIFFRPDFCRGWGHIFASCRNHVVSLGKPTKIGSRAPTGGLVRTWRTLLDISLSMTHGCLCTAPVGKKLRRSKHVCCQH